MIISPHNLRIELLVDRAVFLPDHAMLVLSDVHLGKAATFRAHGMAVPEGDNVKDLERINQLLQQTKATDLVIAGDLLHSPSGSSQELIDLLNNWSKSCPANIHLVMGNHDQRSIKDIEFPWIKIVNSMTIDRFQIIHDPEDAEPINLNPINLNQISICGHIHPEVRIRESSRTSVSRPCFHLSKNILTLPSFGTFTGGQRIRVDEQDEVFVCLHQRVAKVPYELCHS
ncbi:MAG: ligase-associated DNA damage response endonuclease PdeM [Akkermansiaceae bacterium]